MLRRYKRETWQNIHGIQNGLIYNNGVVIFLLQSELTNPDTVAWV